MANKPIMARIKATLFFMVLEYYSCGPAATSFMPASL